MCLFGARHLAVILCAALLAGTAVSARAQGSNPDQKPPEQKGQPAGGDNGKAEPEKKKIDIIAEAARRLTGTAANPECTWIGVRVTRLLFQDDLDTAFRHLDVYDRFGCPGNHIQAAFRCLARQGEINPKAADTLTDRVYQCWLEPAGPSAAQAAQGTPGGAPAASAAPSGSTTR